MDFQGKLTWFDEILEEEAQQEEVNRDTIKEKCLESSLHILTRQREILTNGTPVLFENTVYPNLETLHINISLIPELDELEIRMYVDDDLDPLLTSSLMSGRMDIKVTSKISQWTKDLGHDFVFDPICQKTDADLDIIMPSESGEHKLTPDMIEQNGSDFLVLEFATTRSKNRKVLEGICNSKIGKYSLPVLAKIEKRNRDKAIKSKVRIVYIVVGSNMICSSDHIPPSVVTELTLRKRVSEILFHKMYELGYNYQREAMTSDFRAFEATLESIKIKFRDSSNQICKEDYIHINDAPNVNNVCQMFLSSWNKSRQDLIPTQNHSKDQISAYIKACNEGPRRNHDKRVSNIPIFEAGIKMGIDIDSTNYTDGLNATERLINQCFAKGIFQEENLESILYRAELPFDLAKDQEKESAQFRNKYHLCSVELPNQDRLELSKYGIGVKKLTKPVCHHTLSSEVAKINAVLS